MTKMPGKCQADLRVRSQISRWKSTSFCSRAGIADFSLKSKWAVQSLLQLFNSVTAKAGIDNIANQSGFVLVKLHLQKRTSFNLQVVICQLFIQKTWVSDLLLTALWSSLLHNLVYKMRLMILVRPAHRQRGQPEMQ